MWYKATVPSSGKLNVAVTNPTGSSVFISVAYTESEGILTDVACATTSKISFDTFISLGSLLEGTEVFFMVADEDKTQGYSRGANTFNICAYDPYGTLDSPQTPKPLLSYYSNPVGNRLSAESPYNIQSLTVYDHVGREVLHKTPQQQKLTLDTYTLATGAYLLRVETPEGQQTVKLIKK